MPTPERLEELKIIIDEAVGLRGRIVSDYAHIEFLLGDLVIKSRYIQEYESFDFSFPYKIERRIASIRALFSIPGPLYQYRSEIEALANQILRYEEMRHFMAHGWMMLKYNDVAHEIEFRLYTKKKNKPLSLEFASFSIQQMRILSVELAEYSSLMLRLFQKIYLEQKIDS